MRVAALGELGIAVVPMDVLKSEAMLQLDEYVSRMESDGQYKIFAVESSLDITWNAAPELWVVEAQDPPELPPLAQYSLAPPAEVLTPMGNLSVLSPSQTFMAVAICFWPLVQLIFWAFFLAAASAGSNMAARIAMMAITTRSSMSVNASFFF